MWCTSLLNELVRETHNSAREEVPSSGSANICARFAVTGFNVPKCD